MANLNKVLLIGRLTRDPEMRTFPNGGKVASVGFAVNNRRKNQSTGQWEDEPCFLDLEAFNRGEGGRQLADLVEGSLRKGNQVFIEGHLVLNQWTDKEGQKRQKLKIVVDNLQFLEPKGAGGGGGSGGRSAPAARGGDYDAPPADHHHDEPPSGGGGGEGDIPF